MQTKKIVIIGGTGLIGTKLARVLAIAGHNVIAASPGMGVNSVTGQGLSEAMIGADAVIDTSNIASFDTAEIRAFFEASGRNIAAAALSARVKHHIVLSIVGVDLVDNGYFQGKLLQEQIAATGGVPFTIVRSTQFFEFLDTIADSYTQDGRITLPNGQIQPIAADDVAAILARVATGQPLNRIIEIGGPERGSFAHIVGHYLQAQSDARLVNSGRDVGYFGSPIGDLTLVPIGQHQLGSHGLDGWMSAQTPRH